MKKSLQWFLVIATLFVSPAFAQVFTDQAEFEAACSGLETETFESIELTADSIDPNASNSVVSGSQVFDNFTLSAFGPSRIGIGPAGEVEQLSIFFQRTDQDSDGELEPVTASGLSEVAVGELYCIEFSQNTNSFAFEYAIAEFLSQDEAAPVTIELLDANGGIIVIEELIFNIDPNNPQISDFFGYTGTETIAQAKIRIANGDGFLSTIAFQNVTSGICVPPAPETCFDQIALIKADLALLVQEAEGRELRKLRNAFNCLCILEDPIFWQDDFTRLSRYGSTFFIGGAYTIAFLDKSDNPEVDPIIASLLGTLECIVDAEIDFAIANEGHDCLIENAEDYAYVADALYDEFDLPVVSALAYRLAWLNAFYATAY